jgi:amino acid transporter
MGMLSWSRPCLCSRGIRWNNLNFIVDEIKNPIRNIPIALILSTVVVISVYVLANASYLSILPVDKIADFKSGFAFRHMLIDLLSAFSFI